MPAGRPSIYTPELGERICARIAAGENVKAICCDEDMPNCSTVFSWAADHPEFSVLHVRARKAWALAQAEDVIEIADDSSGDVIRAESGDRMNSEFVQRSRLRVETRKHLMGKFHPEMFGDKQTVVSTGPNGGPMINVQLVSYVDPPKKD